jgi:hypothetical protein
MWHSPCQKKCSVLHLGLRLGLRFGGAAPGQWDLALVLVLASEGVLDWNKSPQQILADRTEDIVATDAEILGVGVKAVDYRTEKLKICAVDFRGTGVNA